MKITFLLPTPTFGGGIKVIAIYGEKLQQMGHDVLVVSVPYQAEPFKNRLKKFLKGQGSLLKQPLLQPPSHLDYYQVNHKMLSSHRPIVDDDLPDADILIATWWETAEWMKSISPSKGKKIYFVQGYEAYEHIPKDRLDTTWRLPFHKIVVSNWLKDVAINQFDSAEDDISLVLNSVDCKQFLAPQRVKNKVTTVGMLYRRESYRGTKIALKAFESASQINPQLQLLLFGRIEISPDLPLPKNAKYIKNPQQDDLKNIYAACDAYLFSSQSEGFGLPILEAMACRTPVIGTPAGAAPDILQDGRGLLLKGFDIDEMAQAILKIDAMIEDEWLRLSDNAFRYVETYTWDDASVAFESVLTKILNN